MPGDLALAKMTRIPTGVVAFFPAGLAARTSNGEGPSYLSDVEETKALLYSYEL